MSYWKALRYLGVVIRIFNAIVAYKHNKKEGQLTSELMSVIYESANRLAMSKGRNSVDRTKALEAAKAITEVIKDIAK